MAFASETATAKQLKDAADALDIAMKALEAKKPDNNNDNNNGNNGNNNSQIPAIGSVIADASGIFNYKVTGNDTVEVKNMTAKGKAKSSVKIAKNIKANGKTYKVTAIAANALKGNKSNFRKHRQQRRKDRKEGICKLHETENCHGKRKQTEDHRKECFLW